MQCRKCKKETPEGAPYCCWCGTKFVVDRRARKQPNGVGYVYRRGKSYTLRLRTYTPDMNGEHGLICHESTKGGFVTKKTALEYRDRLKGNNLKNEKVTLSSYWGMFERDKLPKLARSKQVNYTTAYKRLAPIHYRDICTLTIRDLQDVVSNATSTFYPAKDMRTLLNMLFRMAAADGLVSKDLPSFIELPQNDEAERIPFTLDEVDRIAALWDGGTLFAGYILLMIYTSMMPGELLGLRKSMIDLAGQRIVGAGIKTKRRKTQSIVFPTFITPIIERLIQSAPNDLLLDGYYYERLSNDFKDTLRKAECRELTPYSCRHTTATVLALQPDVAPAMISRIMRHSSRMTERYTHVDDTAAIEAINKMPKHA